MAKAKLAYADVYLVSTDEEQLEGWHEFDGTVKRIRQRPDGSFGTHLIMEIDDEYYETGKFRTSLLALSRTGSSTEAIAVVGYTYGDRKVSDIFGFVHAIDGEEA